MAEPKRFTGIETASLIDELEGAYEAQEPADWDIVWEVISRLEQQAIEMGEGIENIHELTSAMLAVDQAPKGTPEHEAAEEHLLAVLAKHGKAPRREP